MSEPERPLRAFFRSVSPSALPRDRPLATGAAFGCAALAVYAITRLGMAAVGASAGHLHDLGPAHLLWLGPALVHDLAAAIALGGVIGLALRFLPRARPVILTLAYVVLLFSHLVCLVSVPTYGALHATLQLTQLLLAGGVRDLVESGVDVMTPAGVAVAFALVLSGLALTPRLLPAIGRWSLRLRAPRPRFALAFVLVAALVSGAFAPAGGMSGLEVNPFGEFVLSAIRYVGRRDDPALADMANAPHFDHSLVAGKPAKVEPVDTLVATSKLPLKTANVVLFVLESAAVSQLPLWEGKEPTTPRLDELAKHSLIFDDYYTAAPVSMKSLFTIHCSSYPHPHPSAETYTNPSMECSSLSEILKTRGYRTGLFHSGRFSYTKKDEFFKYRRFDVMRDAQTLVHKKKYPQVPWGADDRAAIDDALAWLDQSPDKPFFLDVVFLAPHHPYSLARAPTPFGTKTDLERYRNATLFIDSQIGRVWDWLVAHGKTDNTLLVIAGDHGEAFGEHPGHFTHGTRIYEESMRTPFMLINPLLFHGARTGRVGNHLDLMPTVLDLLGLPKEPRHQGQSLLRGYKPRTIYFYADWYRHLLGLRDGQWKYIYDVDSDRAELYDLGKDRRERHNVVASHGKQAGAYRERVRAWESFYRELIPNYEHYVVEGGLCPGRASCFLDELKPLLQKGDLRRKRSMGGDALRVGSRTSTRGLGVAPLSILRYNIRSEGFRRLRGAVGHHVQGRNANLSLKVSAEIYLDDKLLWSSGKMSADEEPREFALDVTSGSVLELIGYDVDGESWRDYMDWLDVRLER